MSAKLEIVYDFDFNLIGLVCPERDYKLAWLLNHHLGIKLTKSKPINMTFSNGMEWHLGVFDFTTEHNAYQLIRNKALYSSDPAKAVLLPELKEYDYFLRIDNVTGTINLTRIQDLINELPQISYSAAIDLSDLKSRDNLLF